GAHHHPPVHRLSGGASDLLGAAGGGLQAGRLRKGAPRRRYDLVLPVGHGNADICADVPVDDVVALDAGVAAAADDDAEAATFSAAMAAPPSPLRLSPQS
ncbi:MAG: hypothetical protein IJH04_03135, partial [Eggerthellaceae bacterium]|nr:hypothetical protein [Eggerthellaceae bacterium]